MRLLFIILLIGAALNLYADDTDFEIPEPDATSESLILSGRLIPGLSLIKKRTDTVFAAYQNNMKSASDPAAIMSAGLYLNGDFELKNAGFHIKTYQEYLSGSLYSLYLFELFGSLNWDDRFSLMAGKKRYEWGKGYAFNPAGFLNPLKNPEKPELSVAGMLSLSLSYSQSFENDILRNMALEFAAAAPENTVGNAFFDPLDTVLAARLYLLILDTDIDIMGYYARNKPAAAGVDFSRNIFPNLEIHGEYSYSIGQSVITVNGGVPVTNLVNPHSFLLGFRWLNSLNMTMIVEYFHNGAGLSRDDYSQVYDYLAASTNTPGYTNAAMLVKDLTENYSLMQDYLYAKFSWPEPFQILYLTPSLYTVINLNDGSFTLGMPFIYKPFDNFEISLIPVYLFGSGKTEYGTKITELKADLELGFYF